jgi:hypothetical protein
LQRLGFTARDGIARSLVRAVRTYRLGARDAGSLCAAPPTRRRFRPGSREHRGAVVLAGPLTPLSTHWAACAPRTLLRLLCHFQGQPEMRDAYARRHPTHPGVFVPRCTMRHCAVRHRGLQACPRSSHTHHRYGPIITVDTNAPLATTYIYIYICIHTYISMYLH